METGEEVSDVGLGAELGLGGVQKFGGDFSDGVFRGEEKRFADVAECFVGPFRGWRVECLLKGFEFKEFLDL